MKISAPRSKMQENPIPSTSAESHGNLAIAVLVVNKKRNSYFKINIKNGDKIKDIKPKIRSLFNIPPERQLILYEATDFIFDMSKSPLDDEYVLKHKDHLAFSGSESNDPSDTARSNTSDEVSNISSDGSSNEEKKRLLSEDERWLQKYFEKKFGLTKRF